MAVAWYPAWVKKQPGKDKTKNTPIDRESLRATVRRHQLTGVIAGDVLVLRTESALLGFYRFNEIPPKYQAAKTAPLDLAEHICREVCAMFYAAEIKKRAGL